MSGCGPVVIFDGGDLPLLGSGAGGFGGRWLGRMRRAPGFADLERKTEVRRNGAVAEQFRKLRRELMTQRKPIHIVGVDAVVVEKVRVRGSGCVLSRRGAVEDANAFTDQRAFRERNGAEQGFFGFPAMHLRMRRALADVVPGFVLIDPAISFVGGEPDGGNILAGKRSSTEDGE